MTPVSTFSASLQGAVNRTALLPTSDPMAIRDLARTCAANGVPFRISYPQVGRFRYPLAASFTSR